MQPVTPFRELALALYAPSLLVAIGQQAVLIMLPLYALELGGGPGAAAAFLALKGAGTMFADLPSGAAISRFGDQRTMLAGLFILGLSAVGFGFAESVWVASVLALVFGIGIGTFMLSRMHYVAEHCPASHRGRAITVLAGFQRLGTFIGPALGGLTVTYLGYPSLFAAAGALALAGIVLVWMFTRHRPPEHVTAHRLHEVLLRVVRENRSVFARAGSATIALQFVRSSRQLLVPLWGQAIGLDAAEIGLVFGLASAIDTAMFYPAGYIMDFWGRKWAALATLSLLAGSLAMLAFTESLAAYTVVVLLSGLGNGFGTGVVMTIGADLSPETHRGEFLGVWRLIGDVGAAVGPLAVGFAAESVALAGALFLAAGIGGVGFLIMALAVEETLDRRAK